MTHVIPCMVVKCILGDAGDVLAQTFQGGKIFVKGNAGNRVGIQMREYKDKRPYLIIGGLVDDYLGEYMAGGVIMVLGINIKGEPVGNYIGSGMVGGRNRHKRKNFTKQNRSSA